MLLLSIALALGLGPLPEPGLDLPSAPGPQDTLWMRHQVRVPASHLYVVTHRSGLLSFMGHEHAIIPMDWDGAACLPDPVVAGARGVLVLRTPSLVIDSDSARSLAELGGGPGGDDVNDIQQTLLDEGHLAAEAHPEIRLESTVEEVLAGEAEGASGLGIRSRLTVRGKTREYVHRAWMEELEEGTLRIDGALEVRQTDFGIEPESVFGVVKVSDPVDLHFRLILTPSDQSCVPDSLPPPDPERNPE